MIENMEQKVKSTLSEYRYKHCMGVAKTAAEFAEVLGESKEKAYKAGITHDIAKEMSDSELISYCEANNLEIEEIERQNPQLLHAKVASIIVQKEFGIKDADIINAIKYHSVGREKMTTLEKIIYLSDMVEPNRKYKEAEELRELAKKDFTTALLNAFRYSIIWNLEKNCLVHNNTLLAWNYERIKQLKNNK